MTVDEHTITEERLSMSRAKSRSIFASLVYRLNQLGDAVFGKRRMLAFWLNAERLAWRLAFEAIGEIDGHNFHCQSKALSENFLKRWIQKDSNVVDIGCGVGRWCRVAAKYAQSVVGIDFNRDLIKTAKKLTTEPNVEYKVGDVTTDLDDTRFDVMLLLHVIEHIDDADEFLESLKKVGNRLIVEVPDFESDSLNRVRLANGLAFFSDADHVREYTHEILEQQLKRTGWKTLDSQKRNGAIVVVAEVQSGL
jgi:2-polyprenyl-3-methyl-5-hydroxy-6-metoxy-1,4-benzoquinol methylase